MRWLVGVLSVALGVSLFLLHRKDTALQVELLRSDSLEVAADSVREVLALSDSTRRTWERRAFQVELERDSIDKVLKRTSAVRATFSARIDTLEFVDTVLVLADPQDSIRTASFTQEVKPFRITADVALQRAGLPGVFSARLDQVADLPVSVRVSCQETSRSLQSASVVVTAPPPLRITPTLGQVEPRVCNPQIANVGFHWPTAKKVAIFETVVVAALLLLR